MPYNPLISRRLITHLFWNQFPYKVETIFPARTYRRGLQKKTVWKTPYEIVQEDRNNYRRSVNAFKRACLKHVPRAKDIWKLVETDRSYHFFFQHKEDFDRFVAGNTRRIHKIFEPSSENEIGVLQNTKNTYIRRTLFYNAYRFCINFRAMTPDVILELDSWITEFFGENPERFYFSYGSRCQLYLNEENDIILVRLAFSRYILRVQKVILRSEISNDDVISEETP